MTYEVDYVPFATGSEPNVYTPQVYQALSVVSTGVEPGLADPQLANTTWRLASMVAAAVATFISNTLSQEILDDGNLTNLINELTLAVTYSAASRNARTVTASGAQSATTTDYAIGFDRISSPAATTLTLPTSTVGKEYRVDDLSGNALTYPITIALPNGQSFSGGQSTYVMAINKQGAIFIYYGSSLWGVVAA